MDFFVTVLAMVSLFILCLILIKTLTTNTSLEKPYLTLTTVSEESDDSVVLKETSKEGGERCCMIKKRSCVNGKCEPGIEKRCNELSTATCDNSLALCEYMDKQNCKSNSDICTYDNTKRLCEKKPDPYGGVDISCNEFDDLLLDGIRPNYLHCDEKLLFF